MQHRTALVTAATIALVLVTGTTAIAANLGRSGEPATDTTASTVAAPATTEVPPALVVAVPDPEATTTTTTPPAPEVPSGETLAYAAGDAGVVTLLHDGAVLKILDVAPADGWQWSALWNGTDVEVAFVAPDGRQLVFQATVDATGTVQTTVEDRTPVVQSRRNTRGEREREREGGEDD